jgi:hypothetical protein
MYKYPHEYIPMITILLKFGKSRLSKAVYVCVFKFRSVNVFDDEVISLRVWGSNSRGLEHLDDQVGGGSPPITPNPMIIEVESITPHQRGNTRDSCIEKMIYYRIEGKGILGAL